MDILLMRSAGIEAANAAGRAARSFVLRTSFTSPFGAEAHLGFCRGYGHPLPQVTDTRLGAERAGVTTIHLNAPLMREKAESALPRKVDHGAGYESRGTDLIRELARFRQADTMLFIVDDDVRFRGILSGLLSSKTTPSVVVPQIIPAGYTLLLCIMGDNTRLLRVVHDPTTLRLP